MVLTDAQKDVIEQKRLEALNKRRSKNNAQNEHVAPIAADTVRAPSVQKPPQAQAPFVAPNVHPGHNPVALPVPLQFNNSAADLQQIIESKRLAALAKRSNRENVTTTPQPLIKQQPPPHHQQEFIPQPANHISLQPIYDTHLEPQSKPYQYGAVKQPINASVAVAEQRMDLIEAKRQEALNKLSKSRTIQPIVNQQKHNNQIVMNNAVKLSNIEAKRLEALRKLTANKQQMSNPPNNDSNKKTQNDCAPHIIPPRPPPPTTSVPAPPQISVKDQIEANRRKALELRANRPLQTTETTAKEPVLHSGPALTATCCLVSSSRFVLQAKYHSQVQQPYLKRFQVFENL